MALDMAHLRGQTVDVLIDFDVIAQDIHPIVGKHAGLGTADHHSAHTEGYRYTMPLGTMKSRMLQQHLGIPQGTIHGLHLGATVSLPFVRYMGLAYGACAVLMMHHPMMMWVDDTITTLGKGEDRPI